jgi:hypothetical protein
MPFLIRLYRRCTVKIITIVREVFNRVAFKLYNMRAPSPLLETVLNIGHLCRFLATQKRLPTKPNALFNDFLFKLLSSSKLASPLRTFITDKEYGKLYIEKKLGAGITPATLCVLRTPEQVDAYLPPTYPIVIKPTHSFAKLRNCFQNLNIIAPRRKLKIGLLKIISWNPSKGITRNLKRRLSLNNISTTDSQLKDPFIA